MKQTSLLTFWKSTAPEKAHHVTPVRATAKESLEEHYVREIPEDVRYHRRLVEEYELIDRNKFTRVFLQVKTILKCIDEIGKSTGAPIPHIIRGSAGSSLVCYLLGITQIDPIRYGIELARFMNRCRTDIPDIDIDVPYNRREEIYASIAKLWEGQVGRVSNHVLWKQKSALREVAKEALKDEPTALKAIRKRHFDLKKFLKPSDVTEVKKKASELEGELRTHSKHCGGIVLFEEQGEVPAEYILKPIEANGVPLVQLTLNKDEAEESGCIKIDVLSNRGLAQLAEICADRPLTSYPVRDSLTESIFSKGRTIGITFGESRGMRRLFVEMAPQRVEEVAIALALIRPAAAAEGRKQTFIETWKTLNDRAHKEANGIYRPIVFDDDAILKIRKVLQCDSADADRWRKQFAKGSAEGRVRFRQELIAKGYDKDSQDILIDDLSQLIYYSFCKSHALSYAQLVWALAYWKAHHPHAFWCASLNHCHSEYRKWVHYREAKVAGLRLSRSPGPYTLGTRGGRPSLIPKGSMEQTLLIDEETPRQAVEDMRTVGYWLTDAFLPSCGFWFESQRRLDGKRLVRFCGPIATGRVVTRKGRTCTLVCLGVGNGEYIDLVIPEKSRHDLFRYAVLEGTGLLQESASTFLMTVEVKSVRGRAVRTLAS